ncbi:PREDICTED: uncharacterized protein LOC109585878 [Amphimedon queenslandica]|uniref:Uncharacterized protein n=1 Tax=Amphimedon queenslandica TaxID=400682 RepID=A0AAN0JKN4_AMPQE|nr:PREDICTED: uncharacterized protein LOC109585878 [Amphimedon queenslandica]|eukprot:XP_019857587.1 PREDICTED: uncharacterized protein LOC109585878 [Amphimedon queenslandica]
MESQILLFVFLVLTALVGFGQSQPFFGSLPPRPTTGVRLFLGEENVTIANFSMIAAGLFHDTDIDEPGNAVSPDGQNDGLWCQSSLNQNMIGTWYYPDGTTVPLGSGSPLFANNTATGQIGLLRNGGIGGIQGLYSCVILNEEGIDQTLYVAAYGNGDFAKDDDLPMIDGSGSSFQLLSSVDADPPVFSLSFNVNNRPPTIVTCSVDNGTQFNVSDNDLIRTVTPVNNDVQVQVLAMFRMRVSGLYTCSVTTDRIANSSLVSTSMAMRSITVTGSPSNLTYSRPSLRSVALDWSPSAVINAQYHVFVNNSNGVIVNYNTANTELSLSLHPNDEYNIRLVATGEDLPSEIITVTVPQVVCIEAQGPVMMPLDHSSSFSLTCTLILAPEVNDTMVEIFWASPDLIPFNSTDDEDIFLDSLEPTMIPVIDTVVHTLILNFSSLQASQVGEYVCGAQLNDGIDTVRITSNYSVSVQASTPVVTSRLNTTGRIFESNDIQLLCFVTFTPLDVEPNVNISWFGPNGLITMNDAKYSISTGEINPTTNGSSLTFTASLSDNGTDYYCTASVGPASTVNGFELIIPSDTVTSTSTNVIVEIVPLPMIDIMDVGIPVTGDSFHIVFSVTSNTPFIIAGNDNSSAVTLTVARFDINHVDISINIPSVPVAGDVFNLSCIIVVPPNFVENLTSVRWTYDLEASQDVTSENNDATLVPVVRNRNIFTSVLTLDPVKTTDARQYYCQATILVFGTVDRTNRDLTVQISPPSISIVADPPTGPIYESTGYLLTCTATVNTTIVDTPVTASVVWTDPSGNVIPTNEARRQVIPPTGNSLVSMLLFQPIDTGLNNDGGTYTCQMIISSGNSLIASSQPTNTTLNVTVESLPPMTVNFSSVGSVEVGQSLTIICTIRTVERLVVTPMVTFIKMNDTDMEMLSNLNRPYSIITNDTGSGSVTNYTLILDPVRFEDAGMYTCMAEFNVTGFNGANDPSTATYDSQEASDTFNLTVDFPPVIVTISKERDDTLYAGTPFFIKCDIMLDPLVTIPVTVTDQWTRDGTNVPMGSSDATITKGFNTINALYHNATLMFYPLDNADDSGMYTCNVEVTVDNSYTYLRNTSASANTSITVMATPEPVVEIVTMGMAEPGEEYMLNCTVTVVDRLIVSPVITWTKRSANNVTSVPPVLINVSNVMTSLYLRFPSLNTSDAGLYTCEASINVTQISMVARNDDTSNLPLEIPIPSVDVIQSKEDYFLAGSNLVLTCDISVDPNVDTPFTVNVTWNMTDQQIMSSGDFGDESSPNSMRLPDTDRVNISSVMMRSGFNEYRSTVNFTTLSSMEDSGTYTCIVTIVPDRAYEYVMTSDTNYMNVNFTVTGKY